MIAKDRLFVVGRGSATLFIDRGNGEGPEPLDIKEQETLARLGRQAAEEMRERANDVAVEVYQRHHENGHDGWAGVAEEIARKISALPIEGEDS